MNLTHARKISIAGIRLFALGVWLSIFAPTAWSSEKIAVFEFEIIRSNVIAGVPENLNAEQRRLVMIAERLRDQLAASGKFELVDIGPVAERAAAANLQSCGNCADGFARELGASYAFTGTVQKVSELILNINVFVHDAATSEVVAVLSVDLRGNTNESWRRGIDYLYRNLLSPRLPKLAK